MKKLVVLVAGLLSVALFAQAEETQNTKENTFSMKVQIRPRAEYRNGVLFPRPKDAESTGFINNRARLSLGYERDRLSMGFACFFLQLDAASERHTMVFGGGGHYKKKHTIYN